MDRVYFEIFTPEKKRFRLTPNWIVTILWGITILFLWLFESIIPIFSTLRNVWLGGVLAINIYYLISSFFKYAPLHGMLGGEIEFKKNSIRVNEKIYELKNITDLDLLFVDYYGQLSKSYRGNFNPLISQGVNNWVKFTDESNKPHQVYFKSETGHSNMHLVPFINEAIKLCKMSNYRAEDVIGKENVHYR
jgi:hypothetical protein